MPIQVGNPSASQPTGATLGLQLSVGTRLNSHPPGDWAHCSPSGHLLCMLQIPNCPRESNKARAASKSLRHICPSRLQAAGARELRERVWGQLEKSRSRQKPRVGVYTPPDTALQAEPHSGDAPGICLLCVWLLQDGKHCDSVSVFTQLSASGSSRLSLPRWAGVHHWLCPKCPSSLFPFRKSSPKPLAGPCCPTA